jgi:hypothetical protein
MQDLVTGYPCGGPGEPCDAENRPYYRPGGLVTRQQMAKFIDNARRLPPIQIVAASNSSLIYSNNVSGTALYGQSTNAISVRGISEGSYGVFGASESSAGVRGQSTNDSGVYGFSLNSSAGYFNGDVVVTGTCCGGGSGTSRIDHPLDPANKYLYHSLVESPEMKTISDGVVTLDATGEAVVSMPEWFDALNRDFRYQLTCVGAYAPVYIAEEIQGDRFKIAGGKAGMKVSWQVTGIRQDPYANAHRIHVEEDKPADERGKYLHPTEWGQPEALGVDYEEQQRMQEPTMP